MAESVHSNTSDRTFYLVLKGEIAIFTDHAMKRLQLLAPDLPEHVYGAGPWLTEAQIPHSGRLELVNVKPGNTTPADHRDMLINLPNAKPRLDLARFEIDVPFPKTILAGAVQDAAKMKVLIISDDGTSTPLSHMPKETCLAAILVYEWNGQDEPFLLDRASRRQWHCGGKTLSYRSLHVCASGETYDSENDTEHAARAFQKAAELLGINARIDFGGGGRIRPTTAPPGLSFHEVNLSYFETLELRQALGEIIEGGAGKIPPVTPAVEFLGGNCGPIGG